MQETCKTAAAGVALLWFEPVSSVKAVRAVDVLHRLHFVSPNAAELVALAAAVRSRHRRRPLSEPPKTKTEALDAATQIAGLRAHLQTVLQACSQVRQHSTPM